MSASKTPIHLPSGVVLREPEDFSTLRNWIYDSAKQRMTESFPISHNGVRVELADLDYSDPETVPLSVQKQALLGDKFVSRRLRGRLKLFNDATNEQLDEREMTLMRVPYLTERGTFVYNGNEYAHIHQARLRHGAFTRRQNNGDLETQFNVKAGTGSAFRVGLEPSTAQYRMQVGSSNLHLYSLLKDIGKSDEELAAVWGNEILDKNRNKYDARVLDKAYQLLVPKRAQIADADTPTKATAIRSAFDGSMVHQSVVARTLPNMLGTKSASVWRQSLGLRAAEQDRIPFTPDFAPEETFAFIAHQTDPFSFNKFASTEGFEPDLSANEMQKAYNAVYAKVGPRLAGMQKWPKHWFTPDSDPLGWISWYMKYAHGERGPDDERQIRRWKAFKSRTGAQFKKKPTARRAFALRYWAIDPEKLIEGEAEREKLRGEMDEYRRDADSEFNDARDRDVEAPVKAAAASVALRVGIPPKFLTGDPWTDGFFKVAAEKAEKGSFRGCLMARFAEPDAKRVIGWVEDHIPEDAVAGNGYEREIHTTVLFGLHKDVTQEQVQEIVTEERGDVSYPAFVRLGKIGRFKAHPGRPDSDALIVHADSADLTAIHQALREKLGDKVKVTYPDYNPHLTLAYVKPGELTELDDHAYFDGMLLPVGAFIYSLSDRSEKVEIKA